ncbi:hypothetical protein P12x_001202 [Tundrisphaera lichenicola]|uniref:hypothetical protein n=1 Tax=Tundrisphaera lichenicola TaxID=2029860 RepID=UPI003EB75615
MSRSTGLISVLLLGSLIATGCGPTPVDTTYGKSRGPSINGTSAFSELLRDQKYEVRTAVRLTEALSDWADVLVRFSDHPGPPGVDEGRWMFEWLHGDSSRRLVYVVRDFDTEPEFWAATIAAQPKDAPAKLLDRLNKNLEESRDWASRLPPGPKKPASESEWFAVDPKPGQPSECRDLGGPWADGIDVKRAAIAKHEGFVVDEEFVPVLLKGDGAPLAITWTLGNDSRVLAIANGSFLLNASLLNRDRRPLTGKVLNWIGPGPGHVAFVEGDRLLADLDESGSPTSSPFHLFQVDPFGRISAHVLIFLFLLAMAGAVTLGRPLPEPPSGIEKPSAHPEALGHLLARTGRADTARALLDAYRRWRPHPANPGRSAPPPPPSPIS